MKTKKLKINNLYVKILVRFLFLIAIVSALMWILEIALFDTIYENIKISKLSEVKSEVLADIDTYVENSKNNDFTANDTLIELSTSNDCNIILFEKTEDETSIIFSSNLTNNIIETHRIVEEMLSNLDDKTSVSYYFDFANNSTYCMAEMLDVGGSTIYVYISAVVVPSEGTTDVMTILLLCITFSSLFIAIVLSVFFSHKISKPIKQISEKAKTLSSGDLNVVFDGKGYEEIDQLSQTLNYAVEKIKSSEEIQKEVVQNVSHELRTPLTIIQSYAELIRDYSGERPEERQKHLEIILEESEKLQYLISDMIDLSRMQAKTMKFTMEEFNFSESVEKLVEFYKHKFPEFSINAKLNKNVQIYADKKRMEQVFCNLMNNAINYSTEKKKINVSLVKKNDIYRLSVKDFGEGISEENLKHVFDRHFRASNEKRAVAGSGIGLSIVKEILSFHGFNFGVESEIGKGSTFFVEISTKNFEKKS